MSNNNDTNRKSSNTFSKLKEFFGIEKQEIKVIDVAKVSCCDLCFDDLIKHRRGISCSADLNAKEYQPAIHIKMGYRSIGLCEYHIQLLGECLLEVAAELKEEAKAKDAEMINDSEITNESEITNNPGRSKILK